MKKNTLVYLFSYLMFGGVALLLVPATALQLFMSNGDYGEIMPRMVGMFMLVLGFLILQFVRKEDYTYYLATIIARTFIVLFLVYLYVVSSDPFFLIVNGIVLVGLLPSIYVLSKETKENN